MGIIKTSPGFIDVSTRAYKSNAAAPAVLYSGSGSEESTRFMCTFMACIVEYTHEYVQGDGNQVKVVFLFIALVLAYAGIAGLRFYSRVQKSTQLIDAATPYSFHADHEGSGKYRRILVAGDSLAMGVGSARSEGTIAGRLHMDFPDAEIVNSAESGAKLAQVSGQVRAAPGQFDYVIIMAGANDIIRFHSWKRAEADAQYLVERAKEKGDHIVWVVSGNIGLAPIWPWPIGALYTYRTRKYHALFESIAKKEGVAFVQLFQERADDVFTKDPDRYYAEDGLHLSGDGYGVWYEAIKRKDPEGSWVDR